MKKFMDGLIFGAGFSLAFIAVGYVGVSYLIVPQLAEPTRYEVSGPHSGPETFAATTKPRVDDEKLMMRFHDLEIEDQIKYASVIAVAEYRAEKDGQMKAIITDVLKKDEGVDFYYQVGDEFENSSYYPEDHTLYGDGVVIFFTGSPATMRMSMSYTGERITGLGDMPLKLFREKCEPTDTPRT
jgi:hypothetical protein